MRPPKNDVPRRVLVLFVVGAAAGAVPANADSLPTNLDNFFLRGTQPNGLAPNSEIITALDECLGCHLGFQGEQPPATTLGDEWRGSLMAQAARDPVFFACLDIANADAPGIGDLCIRCHSPKAWLEGRSTPTDGSAISRRDRDGITCHFCHRLVDPFDPMIDAPAVDEFVLNDLGTDRPIQSMDLGTPSEPGFNGNGGYVVDPYDRRRGPFPLTVDGFPSPPGVICDLFHRSSTFGKCEDDLGDPSGCDSFESPFHRRSDLCGTCHDVSLPHFSLNAEGTKFVFNGTGATHPTGNKYEMVPAERTYSEWLRSDFAVGNGVDMGGRFGAPGQTFVSQCQHCHMPAQFAKGCFFSNGRDDIPTHRFAAASTWVLDAIGLHYGPDGPLPGFPPPDPVSGPDFDEDTVDALATNKLANIQMLQLAADLEVILDDSKTPGTDQLKVTVINQTGHKLPSGYPEGRRMWINVQFFDGIDLVNPILEHGAYDFATADLDTASTKVYEMHGGIDEDLANDLNMTPGPTFHFALTNTISKDNRIPPRGFTNAKFAAVFAPPVGYAYGDGQYWDDTYFDIPPLAVSAKVTLYYQATSKEYIEFLRDNNPDAGVDPQNRGELAYALWDAFGKSTPVLMAACGDDGRVSVELKGDMNGDRQVNTADIPGFTEALIGGTTDPRLLNAADMNGIDGPNGDDIQPFADRILGY